VSEKTPVWSWESAIAATAVPPLTKLVCLNIARYLSSAGKGWRLTVEQMMRDTGLGNKAMARHLANAQKAGLVAIVRHHDRNGRRTVTEYRPRFPAGVMLDGEPAELGSLSVPETRRRSAGLSVPGTRQVPFQERKATRERLPLPHSRGGGTHVSVVEPADGGNPLNAWGVGE
jgi:hypothetical protein